MIRVALVLALCSTAHADVTTVASVPIEAGVTSRESGRFAWGVRPEILFASNANPHENTIIAIGPYLDIGRSSADTLAGAGLSATLFHDGLFNVTPSGGIYHRWVAPTDETGYALSLFVGARIPEGGFDTPFGVRVDWRADGSRHEFVASAEVDLIGLVGLVYGITHYPAIH